MGAAWSAIAFLVAGVAVVTGIWLLATGRMREELPDAPPAEALQGLPAAGVGEWAPADLDDVRIDQAWRGYRMDEVDALVERLGAEIAVRDAELARLRGEQAPVVEVETAEAEVIEAVAITEADNAPPEGT
jgi:DivIVA domain-containing protein